MSCFVEGAHRHNYKKRLRRKIMTLEPYPIWLNRVLKKRRERVS